MRRLILLAVLPLAACAGGTAGPSLSKRPIEAVPLSEPRAEPAAPEPADAELSGRIAALLAQARAGQSAFAAALPRAQEAARAAGAEGSESWVAAQQLLSAAENARTPTTRAVGELDALIAARVQAGSDAGLAELQAAQAEIAGLAEEQQRAIDAVRTRISR
jgi:hypothetical protein